MLPSSQQLRKAQVDSMTTTWLIRFMQWTSVVCIEIIERRINQGSNDVQSLLFPNQPPCLETGTKQSLRSSGIRYGPQPTRHKRCSLGCWNAANPKAVCVCVCVECRPFIAFFLSVDDLSSFKQDFSFCLEIDFQSVWNMCIMRNFSAENDWKRIRWSSILITSFCRCFRWIKSNCKICIEAVSHNCQQSWFADIAWVAGETVEALGKVFWGTDNQTIGQ